MTDEEDMMVISDDGAIEREEAHDEELGEASDVAAEDTASDEVNGEMDDVADDRDADEAELDHISDIAIETLQSILAYFDAGDAEIDEYEGDDEEIILDVVGGDLAILIGRYGRTLEALQVLVSTITQKKLGYRHRVTIDVESYKHRQRQKIEEQAFKAADRAIDQDKDIRMRPMNPYERRLVHMALRDDARVETHSEGIEPERRVIVTPI